MIRKLLNCQVVDPARGTFMVHPLPISNGNGSTKHIRGLTVYSSANEILKDRGQTVGTERHPESYDFTMSP